MASDQVETESFEWPGLSEDSSEPLFRFGSDIGCLAAIMSDVRDDQIAAGAGDFKIKWKNMLDQREMTLTGHEAPILSIALDPLGEILVSSSCDGTFRNDLISYEKKENAEVKKSQFDVQLKIISGCGIFLMVQNYITVATGVARAI